MRCLVAIPLVMLFICGIKKDHEAWSKKVDLKLITKLVPVPYIFMSGS